VEGRVDQRRGRFTIQITATSTALTTYDVGTQQAIVGGSFLIRR
jgi:hypothetical protein